MKILVIEDDQVLNRSIERTLLDEGFSADCCSDGKEGLDKARKDSFNLIILDISLPNKNGWQVLEDLRKTKNTPVIILTAYCEINQKIKGLRLGADDYITKPFHMDELVARIETITRRFNATSKSIEIDGFLIEMQKRRVLHESNIVNIRPKEFDLIELLLEKQGKPVSRFEIYQIIFNGQNTEISNILDVYISNIRSKTHKDFIKTKRGQGFYIQ